MVLVDPAQIEYLYYPSIVCSDSYFNIVKFCFWHIFCKRMKFFAENIWIWKIKPLKRYKNNKILFILFILNDNDNGILHTSHKQYLGSVKIIGML